MPVDPKCPECKVEGPEKIVSRIGDDRNITDDPPFYVIYCVKCGHVYGVVGHGVRPFPPAGI